MIHQARGWTLVELVAAVALGTLVATAALRVVVSTQRAYVEHLDRVAIRQNLRMAALILRGELRDLTGPDLVSRDSDGVTYRAMRSFYAVCGTLSNPPGLLLERGSHMGLRPLDANLDSLLVLAVEPDGPSWFSRDAIALETASCPDGAAALGVALSPDASDSGLVWGVAVRAFDRARLLAYRDGQGVTWIGQRTFRKTSGDWTVTQPLVGPFTNGGVTLEYLDRDGWGTILPEAVSSVRITLVGASSHGSRRDTLSFTVHLRNGNGS